MPELISRAAVRGRLIGVYGLLVAANVGAWLWALALLHDKPMLLGTALLAYSFGLRHAVDADHIAAIDNVTRKLMQDGQRPVGVGFFFALGHSAVVVVAAILIALAAGALSEIEAFKGVGGVVATCISAVFLFGIAAINLVILRGVWKAFTQARRTGAYVEEDLDLLLADRGLISRLVRPLFRIITRSWHMAPLGFLFGLGFDTATEVSLLGLAAGQASDGLSLGVVMVFPALFAAGMALVDTTDGVMMLGAYEWAFVKPMRKLYYNLVITLISVVIAVVIGTVQTLALLSEKLALTGGLWDVAGAISEHMGLLGYIVIGVFALAWLGSFVIYRWRGFDDLEVRATPRP
ncbi:HoxN/HupN/NixA family nickel/cobalt transporter [Caulobacter segnis]|uniref:HoxN/HupN/NixA family nickel/cobalt transporter n=1 Tax=Caulobacter segnis TaxID=88688 RepID=UPI001CC1A280|nr:HoxN/HupN/NixA family nickel/cobalt transporter [Caulobacter segnis]UAL12409.1 HoxN/HupN/NixA family nickel/cobalt transporter [Caulobacter segnis]